MPEQGAIVKRAGQHVQHQLDVQIVTDLMTCLRSREGLAHGPASCGQNLFADDLRQLRVMSHVGHESGEPMPEGSRKRPQQRANRCLQVLAKRSSVGSRSCSHLAQHGERHQMALARPATIKARAGALHLARNAFNGHSSVAAVLQHVQHRRHDFGVDVLISRSSEAALHGGPWAAIAGRASRLGVHRSHRSRCLLL